MAAGPSAGPRRARFRHSDGPPCHSFPRQTTGWLFCDYRLKHMEKILQMQVFRNWDDCRAAIPELAIPEI
jgi:hypothetical protein